MSPPSNAATLERHMAHHTSAAGLSKDTGSSKKRKRKKGCCDVHCNSLWSVWYGIIVLAFQAFIIYKAVVR
jgi:hypothetical protein